MLALLHAVFAWQAQLGGRGEEAALEAVQGELVGLFRKKRLLVVRVPPLVPGQAGGPAQRLQAVVIAAGHKAGQRGLGDVGQREKKVRLRLRVQLERLGEAGQPGEHPAGAGEVACEAADVHGERLAARAGFGFVAGAVQVRAGEAEGRPLDAHGIAPPQAGVHTKKGCAEPQKQRERAGRPADFALPFAHQ